jgi:hypothetical protein
MKRFDPGSAAPVGAANGIQNNLIWVRTKPPSSTGAGPNGSERFSILNFLCFLCPFVAEPALHVPWH